MSSFEPHLIYDMKSGLRLDRKPWLLPQDAFEKLEDCFLRLGILHKRSGFTEFATFVHVDPCAFGEGKFGEGKFGVGRKTTTPGNPIMGIDNHYLGTVEKLLFMDTRRVNKYNTVTDVCDDLTTLNVRFKTGQTEIQVGDTITGATSGDTAIIVAVVLDQGAWADNDASGTLILSSAAPGDFEVDGENITIHGATVAALTESCSYEEFTGTDEDFFWYENWRGVGYFTNNQDQIRKFNGTYVTKFNIDLDVEGGPDNDVNTCLLIFHMEGRILILRTTEKGVAHKQRLRWAEVNSTTFKDANNTDAPRDDDIMGGEFIGGELIVWFERGVMKIVYTGDPTVPYKWEKVDSVEGCYATMSLAGFSDEIIAAGPTRFLSCDGREVSGIDDKIPDLMLTFNPLYIKYCYSLVMEEMKQLLISYASSSATKPDKALMLNYDEDNFAIFNLPIHTMGYSSLQETLSLDDMTGISLDDLDYSLDDKELRAGYPINLMGRRNGKIYKMNDGGSDDGSAITMRAVGGRWNPYSEEGFKAVLQKIDFLVDRVSTTFDVKFYLNTRSQSYQTKTVDCSDSDTNRARVWRSAKSGAQAEFHQIEITHNTTGATPKVHALRLWFKRGGRI